MLQFALFFARTVFDLLLRQVLTARLGRSSILIDLTPMRRKKTYLIARHDDILRRSISLPRFYADTFDVRAAEASLRAPELQAFQMPIDASVLKACANRLAQAFRLLSTGRCSVLVATMI